MVTELLIHKATADNRGVLIHCYLELLKDLDRFGFDMLPTRENAETMVDTVFLPSARNGDPILLAEKNGQTLGAIFWATLILPYASRWKAAFGYGTWVKKEFRRHGIATALRNEACRRLRTRGVQVVLGSVPHGNQ